MPRRRGRRRCARVSARSQFLVGRSSRRRLCRAPLWGCLRAYIVAVEYRLRVWSFEVGDGQLQVPLAVPGVLFEGKREVDGAAMFGDERLAFGRAPGDATEHPAVLAERHLQMPVFHPPRAVDDLDPARAEYRAGVARAEWRQARHLRRDLLGDGPEAERAVDPEPRPQIVRAEARIGKLVDAGAQLADAAGLDGQAGRLLVAAELDHRIGA